MSRLLLPVDGSCVLYLPFWEGAGTFTEDISRYKNHGTINGATWTDGVLGKALSFNGATDNVDCGTGTNLNIIGAQSISLWLKTSSVARGGLFDRLDPVLFDGYTLVISQLAPDGKLAYFNPFTGWVYGSIAVNDGSWHHCAVTGVAPTGVFYIDGVQQGTFFYANPTAYAGNAYVGEDYLGSVFNGIIDEVRVFNRALSPAEVFEEFYRGVRGNY